MLGPTEGPTRPVPSRRSSTVYSPLRQQHSLGRRDEHRRRWQHPIRRPGRGSSGSCPPRPPLPYGASLAPLTPRPPLEAQWMPPTRAPLLLCRRHSEPHDLAPRTLPLGGCSGNCVGRATWLPGSAGEGAGGWQGAYPAGPPVPHQGSCCYEEEVGEGGRASGRRAGTGGRTQHLKI